VAEKLAEQHIPVIIDPVFQSPLEDYDPYDTPWANAGRLHDAGVTIAFRTDDAAHAHTLPFNAGRSVAFGLPEAAAVRALTLEPAKILGVDDRLGSLTPGKWATLIITDGSPLQPSTQVLGAMIRGRRISLETRHTRFAEKYRQRLAAP
jgi:imidazolonepropionase-like amidohydrolase